MSGPQTRPLILRAELERDAGRAVGHTLEVSEASVLVRTDEEAALGEVVQVHLALRGLLDPLRLRGEVVERHAGAEPGEQAGLTLRFGFRSDPDRDRLTHLLGRCDEVREGVAADVDAAEYRVLLVEDSHLIRDMFAFGAQRYFGGKPTTVSIDLASDAEQAWDLLERRPTDLAIVDFFLPGDDGARLVERVRASSELRAMPVVGISVGGNRAREAFLAAGADIFLDKPVVLRDLFLTLELLALSRAAV